MSSTDLYDVMCMIHDVSTYEEGEPSELLNVISGYARSAIDAFESEAPNE
jgi:hypothetical protein